MNYQILALLDHCYSIDLVLKDTVHVVSFGSSGPFFFVFFFFFCQLLLLVLLSCRVTVCKNFLHFQSSYCHIKNHEIPQKSVESMLRQGIPFEPDVKHRVASGVEI